MYIYSNGVSRQKSGTYYKFILMPNAGEIITEKSAYEFMKFRWLQYNPEMGSKLRKYGKLHGGRQRWIYECRIETPAR